MSHFSVLVRLPAVPAGELESALKKILIPYKESGCGDNDPPELAQYLKFQDNEDECLKNYREDKCSRVQLPDGRNVSAYDKEFRNRSREPFSFDDQYVFPQGSVKLEMPLCEVYATFEQYMADYCGHKERDPKAGRYGSWSNPQQKWDYWRIGGRWRGKIPVKFVNVAAKGYGPESYEWKYEKSGAPYDPDRADFTLVRHVDFAAIEVKTEEALQAFWAEWQELLVGKKFPALEGPRHRALSLGMLECKSESELMGSEFKVVPWERSTEEKQRYYVLKDVNIDWLRERADVFSPISTWARLDANGWQEKGEMGWFGYGSDTPESTVNFAKSQLEWIKSGNPNDWLVVVDCHI